jgi:hypothetical protein
MILDKEELLTVFDKTKDAKPRKNPKITGYANTGDRSKYDELRKKLQEITGDKEAVGEAETTGEEEVVQDKKFTRPQDFVVGTELEGDKETT